VESPEAVYFRGVTIRTGAPAIFRWLCQVRVAPYPYDWIDNGGRRSQAGTSRPWSSPGTE